MTKQQHGNHIFIYLLLNYVYLFLAVLGLCCCVGSSIVVMSGAYCLVVGCGLLIAVASLVAEHELKSIWAQELWLVGSRAQAQ